MDGEMKKYSEMFNAAWKLFYVFRNIRTEEECVRAKYAGEQIYQKYPCPLMRDLIWAVYNEFDRRMKKGCKDG